MVRLARIGRDWIGQDGQREVEKGMAGEERNGRERRGRQWIVEAGKDRRGTARTGQDRTG